jgi:hypothetical protein
MMMTSDDVLGLIGVKIFQISPHNRLVATTPIDSVNGGDVSLCQNTDGRIDDCRGRGSPRLPDELRSPR